jgi:hypothetical protein
MLKDQVRSELMRQAGSRRPTTYKELAVRLCLVPPQTIHRVAEALEQLMEEDFAAGRPMLSALCVSRSGSNLPVQGFFLRARELGAFFGDPNGTEAGMFHRDELARVLSVFCVQHEE